MKRFGFLGNFLIGCGAALAAGLLFLTQGGFDDNVGTGQQVAITSGLTLAGGLFNGLRASAREGGLSLGHRAKQSPETRDLTDG